LKFPDLTVEGSFVLGATVGAVLINAGANPLLVCIVAILAGSLAGLTTGLLHVCGKIKDLLASIITTTALYTVNMVIMSHRSNISIARKKTVFNELSLFDINLQKVFIALIIVTIVFLALRWFLGSRFGMLLRATGTNSKFVTSMGGNINLCKIVGLSVSNALASLCGCLIMQNQFFVDIGMTSGIVVIGFATSILGITFASKIRLISPMIWIIIAGIIYQTVIALALQINFHPNYLKAIMATILAVILILDRRSSYD
jgi:putative ABC transport system permease protein